VLKGQTLYIDLLRFEKYFIFKSIIYNKVIESYSICYMQRDNNMAKTLKFVYTMILFLSLFIVAKEVHGKPFFSLFKFSLLL